jgi:hypothetical protein
MPGLDHAASGASATRRGLAMARGCSDPAGPGAKAATSEGSGAGLTTAASSTPGARLGGEASAGLLTAGLSARRQGAVG